MILPIIMAGGSGTRLWPLSRSKYPKQFIPLISGHSMLQETALRLSALNAKAPMLICNEDHRFMAAEQMRQIEQNSSIILEPVGRNTAPAIALAAIKAINSGEDPLLLVLAADHDIKQADTFCDVVKSALPLAEAGKLVTFGIVPSHAETGYGYIKRGEPLEAEQQFTVDSFVEKPNKTTAEDYLASGQYYWNSGMFLFKASRYLEELKAHRPDIYSACELAMAQEAADLDFVRVNEEAFKACPDDSIDYAVMEKTQDAVVVALDAGWNDVGGFAALWDVKEKDDKGNAFIGDVKSVDTNNTLVVAGEKLIATVGVDDLVVVNTKDAVLVAHKDKCQQVKAIVNQLKADQRSEFEFHREVYRPWGSYDSIDNGERFQVKRITVKPGAKLSVQMHHHRAEHWIVVSGTAKVTNGEQTLLLTENQSTYIPVGVVHALENPGKVPLELIEVQSGSYLGEDDIVRFEDIYGRVSK
ncbi:mannose-1-phosphate guanylyltransferase/mannose-6-phosphate isomerase [Saccharobesus litoralis]|uniref:mannose-1-phosphate guanylyltransferase n=1 Tax=Saccharobesus litoralis TaxID=2172099 RepID=A0A2S0VRD0_9ALTE|nr:mannose-1-phosphate guanylyltransferase/mannose-6-phosphate isomerase [Saccharobesus litoralis]AWB66763.1 mannose-1-phosphate guanylyltransferase/mannose-6-phosphate isomerase [Saccharobesus litoralis]